MKLESSWYRPPVPVCMLMVVAALGAGCASAPAPRELPAAAALSAVEQQRRVALIDHFERFDGVRYRYGGTGRGGMDCSAFIQLTYANVYGRTLPRTTAQQVELGARIDPKTLTPGDLVFFKTGLRDRHAGIYVGGGEFIHASSSRGIARSSLANPYWQAHWWQARRVLHAPLTSLPQPGNVGNGQASKSA